MSSVKRALRSAIAAPGIRDGLRWFIRNETIPEKWRILAHRKVAKRAWWGDRTFVYTTPGGVPLRLLHRGTTNYLYWQGQYDVETTSLFVELAHDARVILDIGAADGIYALLAASANPEARVLAFEPGADAARAAQRNIDMNLPLTRNVELHALALGDVDRTATLYVAGETGGTSSLSADFHVAHEQQAVHVRRGDGLLGELGVDRVDLIKLDTESTEPAVLRGLAGVLERDRPDLVCEVLRGRTERQLEEILEPLGYRYYWITSRGLVARDRIEGDATYREPNYLFTNKPRTASR